MLERVQDLDFGAILAGEPRAEVDPRTSAGAGKFVLQFDDTQEWTVHFEASNQLLAEDGAPPSAGLPFTPFLYSHPADTPAAAFPIESETQVYQTRNNLFHFWIGGEIDTANARAGAYTGVFTLTIEPL